MKTLDAATTYKTDYCIPLWLRDEQIKLACQLKIPRLEPGGVRSDPIAIVCFGPSLQDTWEEIRAFPFVMTCSGAHRFLLDRGIVPTWHVEVDPRVHKIALLGQPHPDVTYCIASTCHPEYFRHLDGCKRTLWHVFATGHEADRVLPRGEWWITGGSNVGLRAMTIARFFGFQQQHIFGMDGNQRDDTHKHAAPHPLQDGSQYATLEYGGRTWKTTPAMFESAKATFHELDMMPDVVATFHGEGLVQEMAKDYVRTAAPHGGVLAFTRPSLISESYRAINQELHARSAVYGVMGIQHVDAVKQLVAACGIRSVLDYGCGKGCLGRALDFPIWEYDPAIPGKDAPPRAAELVVCIDVLEHVEPEKLRYVLDDLRRCTQRYGYLSIATGPAVKHLPDGRNTHLIQEPLPWWTAQLAPFFHVQKTWPVKTGAVVLVTPKPRATETSVWTS